MIGFPFTCFISEYFSWRYIWILEAPALFLGVASLAIGVAVRRSPQHGSNLPCRVKGIFLLGVFSFIFSGILYIVIFFYFAIWLKVNLSDSATTASSKTGTTATAKNEKGATA